MSTGRLLSSSMMELLLINLPEFRRAMWRNGMKHTTPQVGSIGESAIVAHSKAFLPSKGHFYGVHLLQILHFVNNKVLRMIKGTIHSTLNLNQGPRR